jgi:hypothetical protein
VIFDAVILSEAKDRSALAVILSEAKDRSALAVILSEAKDRFRAKAGELPRGIAIPRRFAPQDDREASLLRMTERLRSSG